MSQHGIRRGIALKSSADSRRNVFNPYFRGIGFNARQRNIRRDVILRVSRLARESLLTFVWLLFHVLPHFVLMEPDGICIPPYEFVNRDFVDGWLTPDSFLPSIDKNGHELPVALLFGRSLTR